MGARCSVSFMMTSEAEYHWYQHEAEDKLFYVVEGRFLIDLVGRTVDLGPRQGFRGAEGRDASTPGTPKRSIVLMIETKGVVPTGS